MAQEFLSRKLVAFMREMDLLTLRATFFKGTVLPSMLSAGHPAFSFSSLAWGYRGFELAEVLPSARRLPQPEPAGRSSIHKDPSLPLTPACWFALEVETRQEEGSWEPLQCLRDARPCHCEVTWWPGCQSFS